MEEVRRATRAKLAAQSALVVEPEQRHGASPDEWQATGAGWSDYVLPILCNPHATISPMSKLQGLGKTPSQYDANGLAVGIPGWTRHVTTDRNLARWTAQPDYGFCVRTGGEPIGEPDHIGGGAIALDIDVDDPGLVADIRALIEMHAPPTAMRRRDGSPRVVYLFRVEGKTPKRRFRVEGTEKGAVELLGDGQQVVLAGRHPSGAHNEVIDAAGVIGLPPRADVPLLTRDQLEALWSALVDAFGVEGSDQRGAAGIVLDKPRRAADADDPFADVLLLGLRFRGTATLFSIKGGLDPNPGGGTAAILTCLPVRCRCRAELIGHACCLGQPMRHNIFRSGRLLAMAFGALWAIIWIYYVVNEVPSAQMSYAVSWPDGLVAKVESCEWGDATRVLGIKAGSGETIGVTLCFKALRTSTGHRLIPYPGRNLATVNEVIALSNGNKDKLETAEFEEVARKFLETRNERRGRESFITWHGNELIAKWWKELYVAYLIAEKQGDAQQANRLAEGLAALTAIRFTKIEHHSVEFDRYADAVEKGFALPPNDMNDAQQRLSRARLELRKDAALYLVGGLVLGGVLVFCIGWIARRTLGIPKGRDWARRRHRASRVLGAKVVAPPHGPE